MKKLHALFTIIFCIFITYVGILDYKFLVNDRKIQTNILAFLPKDSNAKLKSVDEFMEDNKFQDRILILLGHKDKGIAQKALHDLRNITSSLPLLEVSSRNIAENYKDFFKNMYTYRHGLLDMTKSQDINFFTERALSYIASPVTFGTINLKEDPFFFFSSYAQRLMPKLPFEMDEQQDVFVQKDGKYWYVYHSTLSNGAFSLDVQDAILEKLMPYFEKSDVDILKTGALFYAQAGFKQADKEVSTLGFISLLGILIIIFYFFRSLKPIFFGLLTVLFSITTGVYICITLFKEIHIISLLFGGSLVGVTIDYVVYYFWSIQNMERTKIKNGRFESLKNIFPAMPFAVLSVALGYAILGFLPFPGIRQIAVLSSIGVITAFFTIFFISPYCLFNHIKNRQVCIKRDYIFYLKNSKLILFWSFMNITLAIIAIVMTTIPEDIRQYQSLDAHLKSEEDQIKCIMNIEQPNHFLVIQADTIEDLLQKEEDFIDKNVSVVQKAISQLIPSASKQRKSKELAEKIYTTELVKLKNALEIHIEKPFINNDIFCLASVDQLPEGYKQLIRKTNTGYVSRIMLFESVIEDERYINPIETYNDIFCDYKKSIYKLFSCVLIGLTLYFVYNFLRRKNNNDLFNIVFPIILSTLTSFYIIKFSTASFSIFHLMGSILVCCIGIDYAIFLTYKKDALIANLICMLISVCSFGFLAFSQTKAIHDFGISVLLGIVLCFFNTAIFIKGKK